MLEGAQAGIAEAVRFFRTAPVFQRFKLALRRFSKRRHAKAVATSIGQLIRIFSAGPDTPGLGSPKSLLSRLSGDVRESFMGDSVSATLPMLPDCMMNVSLVTKDGSKLLTVIGLDDYCGFHLRCNIPPKAIILSLESSWSNPVTDRARLLHAECKTMPRAVDLSDFGTPPSIAVSERKADEIARGNRSDARQDGRAP
jgi:hypothetical protein